MKTCTKCGKDKPATKEFFHSDITKSCGLSPSCKQCKVAVTMDWAKRNPERVKARNKRCREKNGHTYELRKRYGITSEQYHAMLDGQGGVCAICQQPPRTQRLAVDHDHTNGRNRALLCAMCNHALERIENDPDWGTKALNYLARYIEQTVKV